MLNNRTPYTELGMPLGVVYKIAWGKGIIPNPESKALGTKLEEDCDFRAQDWCVENSQKSGPGSHR